MLLIYGSARSQVRQRNFELFWYIHSIGFFLFYMLYFFHAYGCFVKEVLRLIAYYFKRLILGNASRITLGRTLYLDSWLSFLNDLSVNIAPASQLL
jgi:hypothetical protein